MAVRPDAMKHRLAGFLAAAKSEVARALGRVGAEVVAEASRLVAAEMPSVPVRHDLDAEASRLTVTADDPRAASLEYGTRRMAPHPFLRPAVEATGDQAWAILRDALARSLQQTGGGP